MNINLNKRDPVYLQVVRYFKEQIAIGQLKPGQEILSRRELANQLKINPNTAQRAYKEMEAAGLIYTEGNLPSKVTENTTVLKNVRKELIAGAVDTFITAIEPINVPLNEIIELLEDKYTENNHQE
ncbi:MAG: GntR family transcriptional regulator [Carnobacterium sp.]|uniref:GntR family transcriptional regulator n=1 Tax=Carnobacterium antarcticum TaxID=2126436 RepID=A0ABW4NNW6_9LACT|nr:MULTISPECIES: GntR family transcriptional regulator [unclassified Carnobacterium]ALV22497.1 Transcriptional regulator, GntR [Carnobacterium sp. CP1]QQP70417.1 GntR family transcriptional regulator [Carnobacterium sp. CS13]